MALYIRNVGKRLLAETRAYLYRWTHIPSNKWYVGSRTASGCHPEDGYICSSKQVKPLIIENANEWNREILVIGDSVYILELEANFLTLLDAKNDAMSFNRHNGDGKFTSTGKIAALSTRMKMSESRKGVAKKDSHKDAIAKSNSIGFWVLNDTLKYESSTKAAKAIGVSDWSIRNWAKNNKNGWKFQPKEMV